jgi:hypothetical protein
MYVGYHASNLHPIEFSIIFKTSRITIQHEIPDFMSKDYDEIVHAFYVKCNGMEWNEMG